MPATQLTKVGEVVTVLLATLTTVINTVIANPILLIGIAGGLIGTGISIFKKIKS